MSVRPNRGGMGWQEPPYEFYRSLTPDGIVSVEPRPGESLRDAVHRTATEHAARYSAQSNRIPVPEDTIDMIEIGGVWMSAADAHAARVAIGRPG